MKREIIKERENWKETNASLGFDFDVIDGNSYWSDGVCYRLTLPQVEEIEKATNELQSMYLDTMNDLVSKGEIDKLKFIDKEQIGAIENSWNRDEYQLYGRFDIAYDGKSPVKLLEYNAETPTSLVESSVVQWQWLEEQFANKQIPHKDQFNSIHDRLVGAWKDYKLRIMKPGESLHLTYYGQSVEDFRTCEYLLDTALIAGINKSYLLPIEDIGYDEKKLVDGKNEEIENLFKLYPYEWMLKEEFGKSVFNRSTRFIEPLWKLALSNKAFLAILWEKHKGHPNLLPTFFEPNSELKGNYAKKPIFGREGNNVTLYTEGKQLDKSAELKGYGDEGYIYQALNVLPKIDGKYVQLGSWVVQGEAAGIGIREGNSPIINNTSNFCPHYFVE